MESFSDTLVVSLAVRLEMEYASLCMGNSVAVL